MRVIAALGLALCTVAAVASTGMHQDRYDPTNAERARWTLFDMRSWSIAVEAYRLDHGQLPAASGLDEVNQLVTPLYIRVAPMTDAWGTPYRWEMAENGDSYRIISAGADGRFEEDTWSREGVSADFADDAVMADGHLARSWEYR